jgi:outer membrane protein OmpA-like peptidoglycan-associated protein
MNFNIINSLKNYITIELVTGSGKKLYESDNAVFNAYFESISVIVDELSKKATDAKKIHEIYQLVKNFSENYDKIIADISDPIYNLIPIGQNGLLFLKIVFENKINTVATIISTKTNIKKESAIKILEITAFILVHYLNVNKVSQTELISKLELASLNRKPNIEVVDNLIVDKKSSTKKTNSKKLFLIIGLVLITGLLGYLLLQNNSKTSIPKKTAIPTTTNEPPQNIAPEDIENLGEFIEFSLPSDDILHIPKKGVEKAILDYLLDSNNSLDQAAWVFQLDRVHFVDRNVSFELDSEDQIKNIAQILISFPRMNIKIACYTDNLGTTQSNLQLSKQRASAIRSALIKLGIQGNRITAEGLGSQFSLSSNADQAQRKLNRRITLKIIRK